MVKYPDWRKTRVVSTDKLNRWKSMEDVWFPLADGRLLHIKAGFETDGASIPRIFWIFYTPTNPEWLAAAIVHDGLFASEALTYWQANKEFWRALRMKHNNVARSAIFFGAVTLGGWGTWLKHSKRSVAEARKFVEILP